MIHVDLASMIRRHEKPRAPGAQMSTVEITIDNERYGQGDDHLRVSSTGQLAAALRACLLKIGDRYNTDPDVQRLVEAVVREMPA